MADPKSPIYRRNKDRRSAFNRRWIKSNYKGRERRTRKDRREELPVEDLSTKDLSTKDLSTKDLPTKDLPNKDLPTKDLPVPENFDSRKKTGLEKLLVSNTIQLEALTRILLDKGHVTEEELMEMMNKIQAEYRSKK